MLFTRNLGLNESIVSRESATHSDLRVYGPRQTYLLQKDNSNETRSASMCLISSSIKNFEGTHESPTLYNQARKFGSGEYAIQY